MKKMYLNNISFSITRTSNILKTFFLFICILYGFVPFEAGSAVMTLKIHLVFLILMTIYVLYVSSFKINRYGATFFLFFLFFMLLIALESVGRYFINFFASIVVASILVPVIYNNSAFKKQFLNAITWLIVFSTSMFYIQFIVYHLTGTLLFLHEMVFPFSEARIGSENLFGGLMRLGGIYNEPGTYSNFMFVYLFIYIVLRKKLYSNLLLISLISIFLTYSVWGMIFSSYFLFILMLNRLKVISLIYKFIILSLLGLSIYTMNGYIEKNSAIEFAIYKIKSDKGSTEHKKEAYRMYKNTYDEFFIVGKGFASDLQQKVPSLQDSGVLLNLSIVFGILFSIIFSIVFFLGLNKLIGLLGAISSLPIFMDKMYYWDPAFILLFFLVMYGAFLDKNYIRK